MQIGKEDKLKTVIKESKENFFKKEKKKGGKRKK